MPKHTLVSEGLQGLRVASHWYTVIVQMHARKQQCTHCRETYSISLAKVIGLLLMPDSTIALNI